MASPRYLAEPLQCKVNAVSAGVEIHAVQEGIPADQCYVGWQQSLVLLGQLAEAELNQ
jgi:hypothetical protein